MWDIRKFSDLITVTDIIRVKLNSEKCAKQYVVCNIKVWTFFYFFFLLKIVLKKNLCQKLGSESIYSMIEEFSHYLKRENNSEFKTEERNKKRWVHGLYQISRKILLIYIFCNTVYWEMWNFSVNSRIKCNNFQKWSGVKNHKTK